MRTILRPDLIAEVSGCGAILSSEYSDVVIRTRDDRVLDVIRRLDRGIDGVEIAAWQAVDAVETKLMASLGRRGLLTSIPAEPAKDSIEARQLLYLATMTPEPTSVQKKLDTARVAVIGLGGIGGIVLAHLVGAGIKKYVLVDCDCVDISNLNRQYIYSSSDIGRRKVDAAYDYIRDRRPELCAPKVSMEIDSFSKAQELAVRVADCDVAVVGIDTPAVVGPYWVMEALWDAGVPSIHGSVGAFSGLCTRIFDPGRSPDPPQLPATSCHTRALGHTYSFGPTNSLVADEIGRRSLLHLGGIAGESLYTADTTMEFKDALAVNLVSGEKSDAAS